MTFLNRNGVEAYAVVIVRPVGDDLVREITFPYNADVPMETTTLDVAGLSNHDRMDKVDELIHEVAPRDVACWLGRAWKAEIPAWVARF
jgi:hypothetical protein